MDMESIYFTRPQPYLIFVISVGPIPDQLHTDVDVILHGRHDQRGPRILNTQSAVTSTVVGWMLFSI